MVNIFFGLIFVFFKTNLSFLDIGAIYYLTSIIGYMSIFFGIRELGSKNQKLIKIKPYIIFMIYHSIVFFFLNITENSPLTIALSTSLGTFISLVGLGLIIVGMFMIFIIIFLLIECLNDKTSKTFNNKLLYNLTNIMMLTFVLAGVSSIFNFIPMLVNTLMGVLLLLEVLFLISYYNVYFVKNEKLT
ncbi:hypothetical protein QGM71_20045 [Virgibacillus sp. C22-A2]|uniref:Uncharacterized protein n=1 Tax=Virgibacillus tibetensis TaxID=3042313 RepID=A0ABU6KMI8_9BACI|nr:hypothetical protein [Virgibacillus sp. C22-A2]